MDIPPLFHPLIHLLMDTWVVSFWGTIVILVDPYNLPYGKTEQVQSCLPQRWELRLREAKGIP